MPGRLVGVSRSSLVRGCMQLGHDKEQVLGHARAGSGKLRPVRAEQDAGSSWAVAWCEGMRDLARRRARSKA